MELKELLSKRIEVLQEELLGHDKETILKIPKLHDAYKEYWALVRLQSISEEIKGHDNENYLKPRMISVMIN